MRVAALYDVHGNAPALEAVLVDVARANVDTVVFGGDVVWGAWPRETLDLARALDAHFVMGNTDRLALTDDEDPSALWVQERLTEAERAFVLGWPPTLSLDGVLYCHATPRNDTELVTPVSPESRWQEVLEGVQEETVVCGHIHLQYDERHAGRRVVNPGSVGSPRVRAAAWWAIVEPDAVELRTTDYDTAGTAAAWRASGFPRLDFADELLAPSTRDELLRKLT